MCRTAGETHMGARKDDPTGPTHAGYRQYSLRAVLCWSLIGAAVGTLFSIGLGFALYEAAIQGATDGIWERVDPDQYSCKITERVSSTADFTLGMPEHATKYTYKVACETEFATPDNGYPACRINNVDNYGCPESPVSWYSYFVNETLRGTVNQFLDLNLKPIICCVDQCPEWTEHWYCAPEHYNDGSICDCECGYPDPDCAPDKVPEGWRGCCHEDYVTFGTSHLIGCLNGTSPGVQYQELCYTELRCSAIYAIPNVNPFPCGFEATRNVDTMPIVVDGLRRAELMMYCSPLMGLAFYLLCVASYPVYALLCGLQCRPDKIKVMNDPLEPPPTALNLRHDYEDDE